MFRVDVKSDSGRASSGLGGEALTKEASEASAGDVDRCLVDGHAEEFVQLTDLAATRQVIAELAPSQEDSDRARPAAAR